MDRRRLLRRIRIAWASLGSVALIVFVWTFQAHGVPGGTLASGPHVRVARGDSGMAFWPVPDTAGSGLILFPGGIVDPKAYAPLARSVAERGYPVLIVRLPVLGRHAPTAASRREAVEEAVALMRSSRARHWVVAGHSFGGRLASEFADLHPDRVGALVLLATSHPREVDLSDATFPVVKVLGTRDGVAPIERSRANASRLPPTARVIVIGGANHAQFGYYGPQAGDHRATISRAAQQQRVRAILLDVLAAAARAPAPSAP